MRRIGTRACARRSRRWTDGKWARAISWTVGATLVCVGALAGAFGTVAWLTVLCAPTISRLVLGVVALGVAPVAGGGALLWAGLSLLEEEAAKSRVRAVPDERFVEAAGNGATLQTVTQKLGLGEPREVESRLDALCARDLLLLDVSDEGEVLYRAPRRAC
jgi:hypothetical protein